MLGVKTRPQSSREVVQGGEASEEPTIQKQGEIKPGRLKAAGKVKMRGIDSRPEKKRGPGRKLLFQLFRNDLKITGKSEEAERKKLPWLLPGVKRKEMKKNGGLLGGGLPCTESDNQRSIGKGENPRDFGPRG